MNNDKTPDDRATPRTEATFSALVDAFVGYNQKQLYFSDLANACYAAKCDFQDVERELTDAKARADNALIAVDSWVAECQELKAERDQLLRRVEELKADKERLDKIDYPSFSEGGDSGYGYWSWEVTKETGQPRWWRPKRSDPHPSIRDAIDAAS